MSFCPVVVSSVVFLFVVFIVVADIFVFNSIIIMYIEKYIFNFHIYILTNCICNKHKNNNQRLLSNVTMSAIFHIGDWKAKDRTAMLSYISFVDATNYFLYPNFFISLSIECKSLFVNRIQFHGVPVYLYVNGLTSLFSNLLHYQL